MAVRSMIFSLYADQVQDLGQSVWLGSIIRLLRKVDIAETAVRTTVARMAREGWLRAVRHGRRSYYSLTPRGQKLLREGIPRVLTRRQVAWDGNWCVLLYSIPEASRSVRDRLRKELSWLGFGALSDGVWVSPNNPDLEQELRDLVAKHNISRHVHIFIGRYWGPLTDREVVSHCWDLEAINEAYFEFIGRWEPRLASYKARLQRGERVPDDEAFVARFLMGHEFRKFPFRDPDLPPQLLPAGWLGYEALRIFHEYRDMLADAAQRFFMVSEPYPPPVEVSARS
ncbi:MAG TPA: PaaX family transcriptional regulator C-terminal domain-containing protein [Dehalococcoidia bacterium]|nr:PaaX family transcriptional regulator C-terminal domain-containing protein [Dehalococcoidia bacterium]